MKTTNNKKHGSGYYLKKAARNYIRVYESGRWNESGLGANAEQDFIQAEAEHNGGHACYFDRDIVRARNYLAKGVGRQNKLNPIF